MNKTRNEPDATPARHFIEVDHSELCILQGGLILCLMGMDPREDPRGPRLYAAFTRMLDRTGPDRVKLLQEKLIQAHDQMLLDGTCPDAH